MLSTRPTLILGEDDMGPPEVLSADLAGYRVAVVPERWHGQELSSTLHLGYRGVGQSARDALIEKLQTYG